MGTRRIKADTDVGGGRKWTGRSHGDTHAIVLRSAAAGAAGKGLVSGGTSVHRDVTGEPGSLLEGIGPIFGPDTEFIEEKFRELGNQIGKLSTFEERLGKLIQGGNRVTSIVKKINEQQKQVRIDVEHYIDMFIYLTIHNEQNQTTETFGFCHKCYFNTKLYII